MPNLLPAINREKTRGSSALTGLPPDVVRDAARRLGWAALVYVATFFLAYFGPLVFLKAESPGEALSGYGLPMVVALASMGLGILVFFLTRFSRMPATRLVDMGLVFEVLGSFGISMVVFWDAFPVWRDDFVSRALFVGIPWECAWIIAFPVLVPSTPVKTLAASLAAASTGLVTVLLSRAYGPMSPDVPLGFMALYFLFTTYLCAGIAYVTSRVIYRYGRRLNEARAIGSYDLVTPLTQGGMGELWVAKHRLLARPAALKLIRRELTAGSRFETAETIRRRFEREARATAALRSQHTVELYDFGETEDGDFYYVMELLEGLDFKTLVERFGPLPAGRTVYLLRQACQSLGEAHDAGLIHRDIKPANIHLSRLGPEFDVVKLLDFGLVAVRGDVLGEGSQITMQGTTAGTPAFMAPEIASAAAIDGRADLYALGCVAYWLLTGRHVFEAESALATIALHLQAEVVPPSQCSEIPVPAPLEEIVLSCLEKQPERRPESAWRLDERLADTGLGEDWDGERAENWWRLHLAEISDRRPGDREAVHTPEAVLRPKLS